MKQATGEVVDLLYQRRDVFHRDVGIGVLGGDGGHFILLSSVSLFLPGGLKTDWGTAPLQEGSEALLLEIWSRSEERPSRFCGGQKGGELPSFDCVCAPLHDMKGPSQW